MQMLNICVCHTYADARHMDMLGIYILLPFSAGIRKKLVPDLSTARGAQRRQNTICASPSAAFSSIYSVYPLPHDRLRRSRYCRFAYFPAVVHFRKVGIRRKVGSAGNGSPVIYRSGYVAAYYHPRNDDDMDK